MFKMILLSNLQMNNTRKDKPRPVAMMDKTTSQGISTSKLTMENVMTITGLVTFPIRHCAL